VGDEATEAYDFLVGQIKSISGLEWLAEQVEDEVALGGLAQERISVTEEMRRGPDHWGLVEVVPRSVGKAEFLARKEYTPLQRFELIANAIETVVIGGGRIQEELVRVLDVEGRDISITFDPGETGSLQHSYDSKELPSLRRAILRLQQGMTALRDDVANAD
jgi:hypothetical protein